MPRIFISYRRQDSAGHVGWLTTSLRKRFGDDSVFRDIETIEAGADFVQAIEKALDSCDVLLAVIGQQWLNVADKAGRRRLDDPNDFVRIELATALARQVRVIPVLVQGSSMPSEAELPPDLVTLSRRNAFELSDSRWDYDVSRLIKTLDPTAPEGRAEASAAITQPLAPADAGVATRPLANTSSLNPFSVLDAHESVDATVSSETEPLPGATDFWWVRVPLAARRVSSTLARALFDGHYIAAYLRRSLFASPLTLLVGLLVGWLHPDFEYVATEAVVLISVVAALSTLSAHLGTLFLVGFAVGDFVLASHDQFYVYGLIPNLIYIRLPLLIQYGLFGLLLITIPLLTKALVSQLLPARQVGRQTHILIAIFGHALLTFGLVYLWTQAMPLLIQPIFTWPGRWVPTEAIEPLLTSGYLAAGAAVIASLTRTVLQYRTTTQPQLAARLNHVEQTLNAAAPTKERHLPAVVLVVARTLAAWLLLGGLFQSWFTSVVALPVIFVLQAARAGLVPGLSGLLQGIPYLVRFGVGGVALVLVTRLLISGAEYGRGSVPPLGMLLGTAFFAGLIIFGTEVLLPVNQHAKAREPRNAKELAWWHRLLGLGPMDTPRVPSATQLPVQGAAAVGHIEGATAS